MNSFRKTFCYFEKFHAFHDKNNFWKFLGPVENHRRKLFPNLPKYGLQLLLRVQSSKFLPQCTKYFNILESLRFSQELRHVDEWYFKHITIFSMVGNWLKSHICIICNIIFNSLRFLSISYKLNFICQFYGTLLVDKNFHEKIRW